MPAKFLKSVHEESSYECSDLPLLVKLESIYQTKEFGFESSRSSTVFYIQTLRLIFKLKLISCERKFSLLMVLYYRDKVILGWESPRRHSNHAQLDFIFPSAPREYSQHHSFQTNKMYFRKIADCKYSSDFRGADGRGSPALRWETLVFYCRH